MHDGKDFKTCDIKDLHVIFPVSPFMLHVMLRVITTKSDIFTIVIACLLSLFFRIFVSSYSQ